MNKTNRETYQCHTYGVTFTLTADVHFTVVVLQMESGIRPCYKDTHGDYDFWVLRYCSFFLSKIATKLFVYVCFVLKHELTLLICENFHLNLGSCSNAA